MKYFSKKRQMRSRKDFGSDALSDNDPLSGVANLFDLGLVFIVGLIVTLFTAYHLQDLFSENSDITLVKKTKNEEMKIITKKGKKIEAVKVSKQKAEGKGERLGVAYQLEDGSMIYIPD